MVRGAGGPGELAEFAAFLLILICHPGTVCGNQREYLGVMELDHISIGENRYPVHIHFERRRTTRAYIGKKAIFIRLPDQMNREERSLHVEKLKAWAEETLRKHPERHRPQSPRLYRDGDALRVGEREYSIHIVYKEKKHNSARLRDGRIEFLLSSRLPPEKQPDVMATLISRCVGSERLPSLQRKIEELNDRTFSQKLGRIAFKHNKSCWGSCSSNGNINISTRLLFAPDDVLEYVCVHELAHLLEMNHSARFWALVEKAMPDFRRKELWLKENRNNCRF